MQGHTSVSARRRDAEEPQPWGSVPGLALRPRGQKCALKLGLGSPLWATAWLSCLAISHHFCPQPEGEENASGCLFFHLACGFSLFLLSNRMKGRAGFVGLPHGMGCVEKALNQLFTVRGSCGVGDVVFLPRGL